MKDNNITNEVWKTVEGFPRYQVSNFGRVKGPRRMRTFDKSGNYLRVDLYEGKKFKKFSVHRLVAEAFIDNPNNYSQVNHIDGNKHNNRVDNLEWCSPAQNTHHAIANGMRKGLLPEEITSIRELYRKGMTRKDLARQFNVGMSVIGDHVKGIYKMKYLSDYKKAKIRELYRTGNYSKRKLGRMFGVPHSTIRNVTKSQDA